MIYKMKVTITDPNTKEGSFSSLYFDLDCNFCMTLNSTVTVIMFQ